MYQFIIGLILAVLSILVGIIIYVKQRTHKSLSYKVIAQTPLLSVAKEVKGRLRVLYDNKEVEDVNLVLVEILNSGNAPIVPNDYSEPISIGFGNEAHILTAEVANLEPQNMHVSIENDGKRVQLLPVLLNEGDLIMLKLLIAKLTNPIEVNGRIAGVKRIVESKPLFGKNYFYLLGTALIAQFIGIAGAFTGLIPVTELPLWFIFFLSYLIGSGLGIATLVWVAGKRITKLLSKHKNS